ncbi:MAG TPA: ribokinase [Ktedonobacteraceae bacterium]|nr:ribokinase [Ktedonobacteraceae bacterium]
MTQPVVLAVGSLNMDQVVQVERLPVWGETLLSAGSVRLVPGGKGANQAVAMARLGASVRMAGRVGADPFGAHLLKALQADLIDTSLVLVDSQEASGVALIFLGPAGDNAIVVASGANMHVGDDQEQMARIGAALRDVGALVLQLEIPVETVKTLVSAAYQSHVPVVLNLAPAQALSRETLRQVNVLIMNETEARFLHRLFNELPQPGSMLSAVSEASLLATNLQGLGIPNVVITLGAQGAVLAYQGKLVHILPPPVQVIDTTAAGDCFVGAFTVALLEGQEPSQALKFAVYASALKVTKFGAQPGLPARAEVEALLRAV